MSMEGCTGACTMCKELKVHRKGTRKFYWHSFSGIGSASIIVSIVYSFNAYADWHV